MFNILKKYYFTKLDLFFLKKQRYILYNPKLRVNSFWIKKKYIYYCGKRFLYLYIKSFCTDTKISQYAFTRKPFSGPIKKFKIIWRSQTSKALIITVLHKTQHLRYTVTTVTRTTPLFISIIWNFLAALVKIYVFIKWN